MKGVMQNDQGGTLPIRHVNLEIACADHVKGSLISSSDWSRWDHAIVHKSLSEGGHVPRCSGVVEFDLNFWLLSLVACAVSSLWGKIDFIIDFFDGSLGMFHHCPCLDICICGVHIIIVVVVLVVILVMAAAVVVMISARSITVIVIIIIVIVISPAGWALSFFVTTLGPAFRLVVPLMVAIVALDVGSVSFLSIS